jgi:spermidine synthase
MKEYLLVLESSEITILLVAGAFFASMSLGFTLPFKRIQQNFRWLFTLLCIIQLSFPLLFKEIAVAIYHYEIPHFTLVLLGFGVLVMSPLYTILLPYFIERQERDASSNHKNALPTCYGIELGGGLIGVCLILTLGRISFSALVALYFLNLSIIMAFIYESRKILLAAIPISLCYWFIYTPLDHMGAEDFYKASYTHHDYDLIASTQSIYNRIDVLQDNKGDKLLLMNGREYFNSTDLEAFNEYIAGIPSALMPGSRVLIVGTGSLSSVYHASRFAESVESVEIDPQVVKTSMDLFQEYSHIDEVKNWTLHIDDAKHFLGSTQKQYDLIIIDLVPPIYVQTALLYTREFYELAKQHLSPQGVLSIYTGLWFGSESYEDTVNTSECTIDAVFPEYLVLNSDAADMAFIYASSDLPFKKQELVAHLKATGTYERDEVFEPADVRPTLRGKEVISMDNLGIVLEWAPWDFDPLTSRLRALP